MPLYEYRCNKCAKVFELIQKFSDPPLVAHEDCGGEVERLISAPGLHFKGSGWYVTDYARSGSRGGAASPSSSSDSKSESKSESSSSSESKSEAKTDAKPASTTGSGTKKD
jgi:putative FmdB family regulatory protein